MASTIFSELADSSGIVKAKLDESAIKERLSSSIHSNLNSAFRELYANELKACREAQKKGLNPTVEITLNMKERTLELQGVDSLGMTKEEFTSTLAVLGAGGTVSGLGYLAFRIFSDMILFEVYSFVSGEMFAFLGNGDVYQSVPQSRPLEKTGTRVTVTLRSDINMRRLLEEISDICTYSDIDTFLTVIDEDGRKNGTTKVNRALTDSIYPVLINIQDEDLEFVTSTSINKNQPTECKVLLDRLPIQAPLIEKALPFVSSILNIKDERKYPPTIDRERLTEQAQKDVIEKVKQKLKEKLPDVLDLKTLDDFRNSLFFHSFYTDRRYAEIKDLYSPSPETLEIIDIINLKVSAISQNEDESFTCYFWTLLDHSNNIFYSETLSKGMLYVLGQKYNKVCLFKINTSNKEYYIRLLKKYGIRFDAKEEYQQIIASLPDGWQKNIPKSSTDDKLPNEITIHRSYVREYYKDRHYFRRLVRDVSRYITPYGLTKVIFVEKLSDYLPILNEVNSSYMLSKLEKKGWAEYEDVITLEKFVNSLQKKEVDTSEGRITFDDLRKKEKRLKILIYNDQRLASLYKPKEGEIFIVANDDTAFELAVFSIYNGIRYEIHNIIPKDDFSEATGMSRMHYFNRFYYDEWGNEKESYEPDLMTIANCAFHVALAVKDKDLTMLYLKAVENTDNTVKAIEERDFVLKLWERKSASEKLKP